MASLPPHLSQTSAQGGVHGHPIAQFEIGSMRNCVYLVMDWNAHEAAIVDPQKDLSQPLNFLKAHGFRLTKILLTHTHHDHIAGVPELGRTHPHVPIVVHAGDAQRLDAPSRERITLVGDGEMIELGDTKIRVLHTPGHSAGECCYEVLTTPPYLLTGDTLFIRDCGRTDLETGSDTEMFTSLQRIRGLNPATVILPGHHYKPECASTLERELRESPPLGCRSVEELKALP